MPAERRVRADARRNRDALLTAAREAFLEGNTDVHVEEIAGSAGVSVGTLYRHFDTRERLIEEVYRNEVEDLCAAPSDLLKQHSPVDALRRFLLLLVDHAAVGKGMSVVLEKILVTDSPVFSDARCHMAAALTRLLAAGADNGTLRDDIAGATLLQALSSICTMPPTDGWVDEARQITELILDGLRLDGPVGDRPRNSSGI